MKSYYCPLNSKYFALRYITVSFLRWLVGVISKSYKITESFFTQSAHSVPILLFLLSGNSHSVHCVFHYFPLYHFTLISSFLQSVTRPIDGSSASSMYMATHWPIAIRELSRTNTTLSWSPLRLLLPMDTYMVYIMMLVYSGQHVGHHTSNIIHGWIET